MKQHLAIHLTRVTEISQVNTESYIVVETKITFNKEPQFS